MTKIFLSGILAFGMSSSGAAQVCDSARIHNSVLYSIARSSINYIDSVGWVAGKYFIHTQYSRQDRDCFRQFTKDTWLKLLEDPNTDWSANLVLFELTRKDAFSFEICGNRECWVGRRKKEDILFWEAFLKKLPSDNLVGY